MRSPTTGRPFAIMRDSGPRWTGDVELIESRLEIPLHWRRERRIFVNSMSDTFHGKATDEMIDRVFAVMALCPQHTFMVLTKRAGRMQKWGSRQFLSGDVQVHANDLRQIYRVPWAANRQLTPAQRLQSTPEELLEISDVDRWPLPNVWLGVSVENRANKDRIDWLRKTPAAVRFLSLEPLLEDLGELDLTGIHWVIAGGESGPGARPSHPDWFRSVRDQCAAAGVPFFFKQWGGWLPAGQDGSGNPQEINCSNEPIRVGKKRAGRLLDGREWNEFPEARP